MEFNEVIKNRFACRKFSNKPLEKEKLDMILEAGRIAPTAKNKQPFKVVVVSSPNGIASIDKATSCRYNAPVVLVVCGNKDEAFSNEVMSTYEMDSSIVATHMMLEATNLGVNNIWIELFDKDIISKEFDLPSNLIPVCLLPVGYKTDDCIPSRLHTERKPLEDIVIYK